MGQWSNHCLLWWLRYLSSFCSSPPHDGKSWLICGIVGASWVILVEKWQSYWSRVMLVRVLYVIFVVASFVCRFEAWVLAIN
jgi:hypothetical protein